VIPLHRLAGVADDSRAPGPERLSVRSRAHDGVVLRGTPKALAAAGPSWRLPASLVTAWPGRRRPKWSLLQATSGARPCRPSCPAPRSCGQGRSARSPAPRSTSPPCPYDDSFDMGLHVDPVAVGDCDDWRRCIEAGFKELLHAGGQSLAVAPRGLLSGWLSVALSLAARLLAVG
jgi:hypothetical protein